MKHSLLLLSTQHKTHAGRSGYQLLAQYLDGAEFLTATRVDPKKGAALFAARAARRAAFSRWYLGGCAALEWQAMRRLRDGFCGVVHSMWADHDLGFLDLFLNKKHHRLVGTFHHCDDTFAHTIRFPRRLRNFDAIILMSETQRPFFLKAGVAPEKIHVVLHGVDASHFAPMPNEKKNTNSANDGFIALSVGGYRRNFPLLREICEKLRDDPRVRFEIVAPEAWRHLFDALPNVRFFSRISDEELLQKYQTSSVLLHTAENATANNVMLEAFSCGLPAISERIGGIPEYAKNDCAILTAPRDADALADAVAKLASSSALQKSMSLAARQHAETLDWPCVAERMRKIYDAL